MARTQELVPSEDPDRPYQSMPVIIGSVPDWCHVVPPEMYGWGRTLQRLWKVPITPFRLVAVWFLWVSEYWYRAALVLASIVSLVVVYWTR